MPDDPRPTTLRKRAAVLRAARELFMREGYERTSVDAVAARAGVSKRTVYDYYGDKGGIYAAVVGQAADAMENLLRTAAEEELLPGRDPRAGLLAFARRIATRTFASSEYRVVQRLHTDRPARGFASDLDEAPEVVLAKHFQAMTERGELATPDSRRAAEHFVALTFLLAINRIRASGKRDVDAILVDGVDAFVRAYGPGSPS